MASVFLPKGRTLWSGKIRVLRPDGAVEWRRIATGCDNEKDALEYAQKAERAIGAGLTRERAERLVQELMEIAGEVATINRPSLLAIGNALFDGREANIADSTRRKYVAHWTRFQAWAGERMSWSADRWGEAEFAAYYKDLRGEFSATTANGHMTTLSMVMLRAAKAGHIRGNPVALVERARNDSVEKEGISRFETFSSRKFPGLNKIFPTRFLALNKKYSQLVATL